MVKDWWLGFVFHGLPSHVLAEKLKALKLKLKDWSRSRVEESKKELQDVVEAIVEIDRREDRGGISLEDKLKRVALKDKFNLLASKEESRWRKKSRETWLEAGDENTSFFQRMARGNRRRTTIKSLVKDGRRLEKGRETEDHVANFFESLYREDEVLCPKLGGLEFNKISMEEATRLEERFGDHEIRVGCLSVLG